MAAVQLSLGLDTVGAGWDCTAEMRNAKCASVAGAGGRRWNAYRARGIGAAGISPARISGVPVLSTERAVYNGGRRRLVGRPRGRGRRRGGIRPGVAAAEKVTGGGDTCTCRRTAPGNDNVINNNNLTGARYGGGVAITINTDGQRRL
ncbi:Hypothetical protein CINCED_3A001648 [Cinara cedri]|uniref:Uncharacterized protein n=1 Tax=Cinara cedri TaxID=506608 RepID=A0A5E4NFQ8_9HEMI|nr:Hypothetical protein CINCED_3A001648 [Cinara cedri]